MKTKRPKVFVSQIVNQLQKYDRRIQQMAERAYKLRQMLEKILEEQRAIYSSESEGSVSSGSADRDAGQLDLSITADDKAVLGQQPPEFRDNSGGAGLVTGSAV